MTYNKHNITINITINNSHDDNVMLPLRKEASIYYIYIYIERERVTQTNIYIYIYIAINIQIYI